MAKTLLLGRAGTGKTRTLMDAVAEAIREGRDDRVLLLVPTYGRGEHLKRALLSRLGGTPAGFLDRSIVTFTSLAERLLGGTPIGALASPGLRDRLLRRALREAGEEPFARVREFPGFRGRFLGLVKEVKESALPADEAAAALDDLARALPARAARRRMEGFARVFRVYGEYLRAEGRIDHEDFQAAMLGRIREAGPGLARPLPRPSTGLPGPLTGLQWFGVDGFTDFTALQLEVVDRLAALVPEAVLTLPFDSARPALFATSAETRTRFGKWGVRVIERSYRVAPAGDLARLEASLFAEGDVDARDPDQSVRILECADPADEADRVARTAAVWMRADGFAAREILVVHRDLAGARPLLEEAFARHGVPLCVFASRPLSAEPLVRSAIEILRPILAPGEPAAPEALRDRVLAALSAPDGLRPTFAEANPDRARGAEEAAALGSLLRLVAETAALLAREGIAAVDPARFLDDLEKGAARASFQPRDRRLHAVSAVDAEEARQWEARGVLLAGLEERVFPRPPREDLFLRDEDRRTARGAKDAPRARLRLALHLDRRDEERLLFYVACTRARERLVLSWSSSGTEGERRLRSSFLDEVDRIWPEKAAPVSRSGLADPAPLPEETIHRVDLLRGALLRVAEPALRGGDEERRMLRAGAVLDALAARSKGKRDPDLARAAALAADPVARIPRRKEILRTSASALSAHGQCRYLHFARNVLRVAAPVRMEEEGLDPLRLGSAAHLALERWFHEGRTGDVGALFDGALAETMEGVPAGLDDRVLARRAREAVVAFAAFEGERVDARRPYRPAGEEVGFGSGQEHPPLVLRARGRRIEVRGFFDRIDLDGAGNAVVVDYKMSFGGKKYTAREHEAALIDGDPQVPLYLAAIRDAAGLVPAGVEIADIVHRRVTGIRVEGAPDEVAPDPKSMVVEAADIDRIVAALAARAGAVAAALAKGDVTPFPKDFTRCGAGNCEFADLCRFEKGRP